MSKRVLESTSALRRSPFGLHLAVTLVCVVAALGLLTARDAKADPVGATYGYGNQGAPAAADVDTATGTARVSYPLLLPQARGTQQPLLSLRYAHTGGLTEVGVGWTLGLPVIERHGEAGSPPTFGAGDSFELSGARLTQICKVTTGASPTCPSGGTNVSMPAWASNWTLYRPVIDSTYTRAFLSPDNQTWRVQYRTGDILEFGAPLLVPSANPAQTGGAIDADQKGNFRWNLVRQAEAYTGTGTDALPKNLIVYSWRHTTGAQTGRTDLARLTDIFYTPPASGDPSNTSAYAHHVRLNYSPGRDTRYQLVVSSPWQRAPDVVVSSIDIASKGAQAAREQIRRYHLQYANIYDRPHLTNITLEGRCVGSPVLESAQADGSWTTSLLPAVTNCPLFGAGTTYSYTPAGGFGADGSYVDTDAFRHATFGTEQGGSFVPNPAASFLARNAAVLDVNRDGLADLVQFGTRPAVFLNTGSGTGFVEQDFTNGVTDIFSDTTGLSVIGSWSDGWAAGFLYRGSGIVAAPRAGVYPQTDPQIASISDGEPLALLEILPAWGLNGRYGNFPHLPPPHVYGDLDGDGTIDVIYLDETTGATEPPTKARLSRRAVDGVHGGWVQQFLSTPIPRDPTLHETNLRLRTGTNAPLFAALADMNGDGIVDYVTTRDPLTVDQNDWVYIPGKGDGTFGCDLGVEAPRGSAACIPSFHDPGYNDSDTRKNLYEILMVGEFTDDAGNVGTTPLPALTTEPALMPLTAFHDVNGDGRADYVRVLKSDAHTITVEVWINLDGIHLRRRRDTLPDNEFSLYVGGNPNVTKLFFGDLDGNGTDDVVVCGTNECAFRGYSQRAPNGHAGLLTRIDHEGGATTTIEYFDSLGAMEQEQLSGTSAVNPWPGEGKWRRHAPTGMTVVRRVETDSNTPAPYGRAVIRNYFYRDPAFDHWRNRLRGFARTRVVQDCLAVDTTYLFEGCLLEDPIPYVTQTTCLNPEVDPAATWNGQPASVVRLDACAGTPHSTVVTQYSSIPSADANVAFAFPSRVDTYLYDTAQFVPSPTSTPYYTPLQTPLSIPIEGDAAHLRRDQQYDGYGNLLRSWDYGQIDGGGTPVDRPIHVEYQNNVQPLVAPAMGLQFRTTKVTTNYDSGGNAPFVSGVDAPTREISYSYDSLGRLSSSSAVVHGVLPLARSHEAGHTIAPTPGTVAAEGATVTLASLTYDDYGHITRVQGPTGECQQTDFATDFQDQPIAVHSYLSVCGLGDLKRTVQYDRGFNTLVQAVAPSGETWQFSFEAFGRLSTTSAPNATAPNSSTIQSTITYSPPASALHWARVDRLSANPNNQSATWTFADNLGAPVITFTQADSAAGDASDWIAHPAPIVSSTGQPLQSYRPSFYAGNPATYAIAAPEGDLLSVATYDFMSRPVLVVRGSDAHISERHAYHSLSVDSWDAENIQGDASHIDMYATVQLDGHGRTTQTVKRTESGNIFTDVQYTATGEVAAVDRGDHDGAGPAYRRWFLYDSLGRMTENAEPNSSRGFGLSPAAAAAMLTWRYVHDASGRVVGTSDARGCGKNIAYDKLGRVVSEDFSPCLLSQANYTPINGGNGSELFNTYDTPEPGQTTDYGANANFLLGKLVSTQDRGAHTRYAYDGRGRRIATARAIAKPGVADSTLSVRYANQWFRDVTVFDDLDRVAEVQTGTTVSQLMNGGHSVLDYHYSKRGVVSTIDGSYGTLLLSQRVSADGLPEQQRFGDAGLTQTDVVYDGNRRALTYSIAQTSPLYADPLAFISQTFGHDEVGNVLSVADGRDANHWDPGAQPVTRSMSYDALYRLTHISYDSGSDGQISPFDAEESAGDGRPIPHVVPAARITWQAYGYDLLGNIRTAFDNEGTNFERGLGTVSVGDLGAAAVDGRGPNQLLGVVGSTPTGAVEAHYDAAGNLVDVALERDGSCSGPLEKCAQRFVYDWDEVGQLARARRWDYPTLTGQSPYPAAPPGLADADLSFQYSGGNRVTRMATDPSGTPTFAVNALASVRLNHASYNATTGYERSPTSESLYLGDLARVVWNPSMPNSGTYQHVLLNFGDHLGSSSVILDKDTSEVVEYITYQAYGATESDYRPTRWQSFREDFRFTGKEEDIEVGLTYFGARYYSPYLSRFVSPDPLTVHGLGSDLNPYAYVSGRVFNSTDPFGLAEDGGPCGGGTCGDQRDDGPSHQPSRGGPGSDPASGGGGGAGAGAGIYKPSGEAPKPPPPPPPSPGVATRGVVYGPQTAAQAGAVGYLAHWIGSDADILPGIRDEALDAAAGAFGSITGRVVREALPAPSPGRHTANYYLGRALFFLGQLFASSALTELASLVELPTWLGGGRVPPGGGGGGGATFFHGTDVASAEGFLAGAELDAAKAAAAKIDGPAGFFLATAPEDAAYFAARRGSGTVLQYSFSPTAVQRLGGLQVTPLGPLGKFGQFAGGEAVVGTDLFGVFNSLREAGHITITPFRF